MQNSKILNLNPLILIKTIKAKTAIKTNPEKVQHNGKSNKSCTYNLKTIVLNTNYI